MVEEALDDVLHKKFHSAQSDVQPVIQIVVEQISLRLICEDAITKSLENQIPKFSETYEAAEGLSKNLLTFSFLWRLFLLLLGEKKI